MDKNTPTWLVETFRKQLLYFQVCWCWVGFCYVHKQNKSYNKGDFKDAQQASFFTVTDPPCKLRRKQNEIGPDDSRKSWRDTKQNSNQPFSGFIAGWPCTLKAGDSLINLHACGCQRPPPQVDRATCSSPACFAQCRSPFRNRQWCPRFCLVPIPANEINHAFN